ncbi:hypothetical protein VTN96DRAFT_4468 [Rasamsonia emersonii]
MSQNRQRNPNVTVGSQVDTETESHQGTSSTVVRGTLRLRGESVTDSTQNTERPPTRHIRWREDVVNNEGMGKKSSKVCCIYHKPRPVGESSSESSSSSDSSSSDTESDSDSDVVNGQDRAIRGRCSHADGGHVDDSTSCPSGHHHKRKSKKRKPSPNAYERVPKSASKRYSEERGT